MKAHVRHILVETQAAADDLARRLGEGEDFADLARAHSQCPSAEQGGDLGELTPGEMVREFDNIVFFAEVGPVHGPVKSPLGYHLIEILDRMD
jgi:peptidyl-prolyl cis-trans isomerase C